MHPQLQINKIPVHSELKIRQLTFPVIKAGYSIQQHCLPVEADSTALPVRLRNHRLPDWTVLFS